MLEACLILEPVDTGYVIYDIEPLPRSQHIPGCFGDALRRACVTVVYAQPFRCFCQAFEFVGQVAVHGIDPVSHFDMLPGYAESKPAPRAGNYYRSARSSLVEVLHGRLLFL